MVKFVLENWQYIVVACLCGVAAILGAIYGARKTQALNDEHKQ